ncbi:MAG: cupin domain-containing protein [Candidatus Latescibacteria bacterium]|nr:cupin domain-containing protein [Candidatus Latescibacterota bacterium]
MRTIFRWQDGDKLIYRDIPRQISILIEPRTTGSQQFAMGLEVVDVGSEIPRHIHPDAEEILFIYDGQGRIQVGDETQDVGPETTVFIPKDTWHSLVNTGTISLKLTWTFSPAGFQDRMRALAREGIPYQEQ